MEHLRLWYESPAKDWEREALPVGNGRLGAMIYGGITTERIQFNEETLFSGKPSGIDERAWMELENIRGLLTQGDYREAQRVTENSFLKKASYGDNTEFGSYQNFGELEIIFLEQEAAMMQYRRELDITEAVAGVSYLCGEKRYRREYFSSYPDNAIAIKLSCDQPRSQSLRINLIPGQDEAEVRLSADEMVLSGRVEYMAYEARVKILCKSGAVEAREGTVWVHQADSVEIYITAATEYQQGSRDYKGRNPKDYNNAVLQMLQKRTWEEIKSRHIADYRSMFQRVDFTLGEDAKREISTDQRMESYRKGEEDYGLEALLFQYGRYLLISSSRPGTLPANLQGIWNNSNDPEWGSMFCYNINLNMNYWLAENTNLHECHEPMIRFIDSLRESGRRSAKAYFGLEGWFASKKSDVWGFTQPYADAVNGLFIGGGGWLCQDIWEYYSFSQDLDFLRETGYPFMKESALFYLGYLTENKEGYLVSSPSTSPEHHFYFVGKKQSVCDGTEMDHRIVEELFTNCIRCCELLNTDEPFKEELEKKLRKLAPSKISHTGLLQEWYRDFDYPEKQHRHLSHLYGIYPGRTLISRKDPALTEAAKKSLNERGDKEKGWSRAWKINLWARFSDGNRAYQVLRGMIEESVYHNLFDTHPPFQVDGNLGYSAGVAELLLQSSLEEGIHLLPALPEAWPSGRITGLRGRGNVTADISWTDGKLDSAVLYGSPGQSGIVHYDGFQRRFVIGKDGTFVVQGDDICIKEE